MKENFLTREPKDLQRKSVIFNLAANLLNAAASVILLMFVTRFCGTSEAGVFSIGFSTAQMLLTIGQYGMRNFQASDVIGKYAQEDYLASRVITNLIMMAGAVGFVLVKGYYAEKALILVILCLLKVTDAFDDVFGGYYQLNGRLDISGKLQLIRISLYCVAFTATLGITRNVLLACVAAVVVSAVLLIWVVAMVKPLFPSVKPKFRAKKQKKLLIDCLPLCLGAFLILYMGNAPKYAIDAYMASEYQAIYNYLFMPCYVICLFMTFVLQPLLVRMSRCWVEKKYAEFKKICVLIIGAGVLLSIFVIVAGHFLGCPLLGWFYSVDVSDYVFELTILLIGGAGYALAVILQTILTVMRQQYTILAGFAISSVLVTVCAPMWVQTDGIMGAAWSYLTAAGALFAVLLICFLVSYHKNARSEE